MLSTLSGAIKSTGRRFQSVQLIPSSAAWGIDYRGSLPSFFRLQSMAPQTQFLHRDLTTSASNTANTTTSTIINDNDITKDLEYKGSGVENTATVTTTSETTNKNKINTSPRLPTQRWTLEDISKISQLIAEGKSVNEIHAHFPFRTLSAIDRRRKQIRQSSMSVQVYRPWSAEEEEKLKTFIQQGKEMRELQYEFPQRSFNAVASQFRRFRDKEGRLKSRAEGRKKHPWTEEENKRICEAVEKGTTIFEIHQQFPGRSHSSIRQHMSVDRYKQSGIYQQHESDALDDIAHMKKETKNLNMMPRLGSRKVRPWTPEEDSRLRDLVAKNSDDLPGLWNKMNDAYESGDVTINGHQIFRTGESSRKRWSQLNSTGYRTGLWDAEEIMKLKQSIQEQIGEGFQVMIDVSYKADAVAVETTGQDTRPCLKIEGPELKNLDWRKVSQQVGTRNTVACRKYLMDNLHNGKRGFWSLDEIQRLKDGVKKFGPDWQMVSEYVGTRSRTQACNFYCKRVMKNTGVE